MKKYFLPFLLLFFAAIHPARAQQYIFLQDSTSVSGTTYNLLSENEVDAFIYFHNNSSKPVIIKWELIYDTVPSTWTIGVCDNNQCYYNYNNDLLNATKLSDTIPAGDTMFFKTEFIPNCDSGMGAVRVSANIFGTFTYDTLTFVANISTDCSAAGVTDLSADIKPLQLFPNPASGNINAQGLPLNIHTLQIDILGIEGQVLQSLHRINNSYLNLDCRNLPAGVYLIRVSDLEDGSVNMGKFFKL